MRRPRLQPIWVLATFAGLTFAGFGFTAHGLHFWSTGLHSSSTTHRLHGQEAVADSTSFAEQVQPILNTNCVQCHGGEVDGVVVKEVSLDLTTYEGVMAGSEFGAVVEAGNPGDSFLFVMVEEGDMPQDADPLPPEAIETIRKWIAEGALNN